MLSGYPKTSLLHPREALAERRSSPSVGHRCERERKNNIFISPALLTSFVVSRLMILFSFVSCVCSFVCPLRSCFPFYVRHHLALVRCYDPSHPQPTRGFVHTDVFATRCFQALCTGVLRLALFPQVSSRLRSLMGTHGRFISHRSQIHSLVLA